MRPFAKTIALLLLSFCICFGAEAQQDKRKQLESEKRKLLEDIEYKNQLLIRTKKEKTSGMNDLVLTKKKIDERARLITNIRTEINLLSDEIELNKQEIESMKKELKALRDEYAKMIQFAYKNRNKHNMIMFVFAAEDFNQAYKRVKYLREYSGFRKRQTEAIKRLEDQLMEDNRKIKEQITYKEDLLSSESQEKTKLSKERQEQEKLVNELRKKEQKLIAEIEKNEKERAALSKAIERIIAEEMKKAAKNDAAAKGSPDWRLTPEALALAEDFTGNKGKLPWPTEKGVITQSYGIKPHAVLSHLKVKNDGVTISTKEGEKARAVFDGEVSKVIVIPGAGKAVIIRHGDYLTAYKNIDEIHVKTGDKVKAKQPLGTIRTTRGKTEIEFQIRKGQNAETLDPAYWLFKGRS